MTPGGAPAEISAVKPPEFKLTPGMRRILGRLIGSRQAEITHMQNHQRNAAACQEEIEDYMAQCRAVLGVPTEHQWSEDSLAFVNPEKPEV